MSVASQASDKIGGQVPQKISCPLARRLSQLVSSPDSISTCVCPGGGASQLSVE